MGGYIVADKLSSLEADTQQLYEWKMTQNPFQFLNEENFIVPVPRENRISTAYLRKSKAKNTTARFGKIMNMVLSIETGNKIGIFDQMVSHLSQIRSYLLAKVV